MREQNTMSRLQNTKTLSESKTPISPIAEPAGALERVVSGGNERVEYGANPDKQCFSIVICPRINIRRNGSMPTMYLSGPGERSQDQ